MVEMIKEGQGGTDVRPDQRNRDLEELGQAACSVRLALSYKLAGTEDMEAIYITI